MTKKLHDSKKRIAFPIQLFSEAESDSFALPTEIHVVPTGKWDHPVYGEMEITSEDIAQFVRNFKAKVRRDLPITAGHDNGMSGGELPAIGWFKELVDRGVNGLHAFVEWTEEGKKLLTQKAYKYFSPEFYEEYEDPETRQRYSHVLVGGALTNSPYFKELKAVVFSEPVITNQFNFNDTNMNKADILAKKASGETLSAEEIAFLKTADLTEDEKATVKTELEEGSGDNGGEGEGEGADAGNGEGDDKGGEGEGSDAGAGNGEGGEGAGSEVNASEKGKTVMMKASEVALLKDKADKGAQAFAELESMKLSTKIEKMTFSETNKSGHFLPKQKEAVLTLMKSFNEKQRSQFENIINQMPAVNLFSEKGDAGAAETSAKKEFEEKIQAKIKASEGGKKLKYSDAMTIVSKENPELVARYEKELAESADAE